MLWQVRQLHKKGISGVQVNYSHYDTPGWLTEMDEPRLFTEEWWKVYSRVSEACGKLGMGIGLSTYTLDWPRGAHNLFYKLFYSRPELNAMELVAGERVRVHAGETVQRDCVAGQFAGYNEISVKRTVSRDGISLYYLNGTRCRRKDVRDLFLGTGLGARSYSIIEQGMISEVVEAKPEEIRGHLEEAAGISKYKERRRETERRIQHTRDNLSRLTDLREEVGKHLARLKRQANAAERYKKLKAEKRDLEPRLATLRWRSLMQQAAAGQQELGKRETALQESIAKQRAAEAALEKLHEAQVQAGESHSEVQGELYAVGSEIARLEQSIQHARELHQRQQQEFEETEAALRDLEKHKVLDKAQVEDLSRSLAEVEPKLASARSEEEAAIKALTEADEAVSLWQKSFEKHHQVSTERNREADRTRSEIEVLDQRLLQASKRIEALEQEAGNIDTGGMQDELAAPQAESKKLGTSCAGAMPRPARNSSRPKSSIARCSVTCIPARDGSNRCGPCSRLHWKTRVPRTG